MRRISETIARLAATRRSDFSPNVASPDRLTDLEDFGSNPGQLKARTYVPETLAAGAPLVVVLHGCTQTGAGYDHGSGWSILADRHGFALLYPEQQRSNNFNLCFNWYVGADTRRGSGEALSIRQMIDRMIADHALDGDRVFVTGLSAGGAMTSVMLATYPEVFAGGAIIAGLPFDGVTTLPQALDRMRGARNSTGAQLGASIRAASPHRGPWPKVSIWHGSADPVVAPSNMEAIIDQWRTLHALPSNPSRTEQKDGHLRRIWRDVEGHDCIEAFTIAGMGHGTPIDPHGADGSGAAGPHMLDVGLSSAAHILDFWGIAGPAVHESQESRATLPTSTAKASGSARRPAMILPETKRSSANHATGVAKVIDDALRAAGLML